MAIEVAKKFQFKYENFLWLEIHDIRQVEKENDYPRALSLLLSLFSYLPDSLKKQFRETVKNRYEEVRKVFALSGVDFYTTHLRRNRAIANYARKTFPSLMDAFSTELWRLGYMERVGASPKRPSKERMRVPEFEVE